MDIFIKKSNQKTKVINAKVMYYIILTIQVFGGRSTATNPYRPSMVARPLFYPSDMEHEDYDGLKMVSRKYVGILSFDQLIQFLDQCEFTSTCQTMGSLTMEYGWLDSISFQCSDQDYYTGVNHTLNAYISPIYDNKSLEAYSDLSDYHKSIIAGHLGKILNWLEHDSLEEYYDIKREEIEAPEYLKSKFIDVQQLFIPEFV